jgi:MFS family permease
MYSIDWARVLSGARPADGHPRAKPRISPVVWGLGVTSFFTDISSEMVSSVLPIYLVAYLHLNPLAFGALDGLYQGFAALARLAGGFAGDKWRNHKGVAAFGYALSAVCKLALLAAGNVWTLLAAAIALERTGKGIRTAPRDALISANSGQDDLAVSFGVHRALDAAGALLGPLVAFTVFWFLPGAFDVVFVLSFCIAVVGVGVIVLLVRAPQGAVSGTEPPVSLSGALGLLRVPNMKRLLAAGGVLSLATVSDSFVFLTLQQQLGFATTYFPLLYVGVAGFNSILAVPLGRIADTRGRRQTFIAGHVVLLSAYVVLLAPVGGFGRLVLGLGLLGAYYAATDGVLSAMASATLPPRLCGSGLALLVTVTNTGRLLASLVFGALWYWTGLWTALAIFAGGLVVAIAVAAATLGSPSDSDNARGSVRQDH